MVKCDICGKECKTAQGLAGHKQWAHGIAPDSAQLRLQPSSPLVTESKLEQRLTELEQQVGKRTISRLEELLGIKEVVPLSKITESHGSGLIELKSKIESLELRLKRLESKLSKQLTDLQQQLNRSQSKGSHPMPSNEHKPNVDMDKIIRLFGRNKKE